MMKSNYQPMFALKVTHSYFEQGICTCLRFDNGPITQTLLKRYGIRKRDFDNGFELYVNTPGTVPDFLDHIANTTGFNLFDFEIQTTVPAFYLFTELPTNQLNQLTYDSSSALNTTAANIIQLTAAPVSGNGALRLGTLTVHFTDIIKAGENVQFAINYAARSTQWQYYVINRSAVQLSNPAITGKANISFDGPEMITLDSGQQAMLFTSGNKLIPLSRVPQYKFDLVNNPGTPTNRRSLSANIVFKDLPAPDPMRIGNVVADGGNLVVSPMYVYV